MRLYKRGNSQYLDLGVIDGKRVRLSTERLLKLIQLHGLLGARVQRPIGIEKAMREYMERCSNGTGTASRSQLLRPSVIGRF